MAEILKEIKTKIALKTLSYSEWDAIKATYKPLKGEVCICTIPEGNAEATNAPTVLFKVGDGVNFYKDLKWASALAADVYDWAKKPEADFITWVNTVVEHPAAPDLTPYLVKENITTGGANGTIAVRGEDVAVKGLGSAAYTDAGAYATAEQGGKADSAAATIATYGDIVTHNASEFAPHDIDTGVHSVSLASGSNNGTVKLTVDGAENEVAVTGLGSAAYVTVDSLNATAKGYADGKDGAIAEAKQAGVDAANALNTYSKLHENDYDNNTIDGKVAAVLGTSADGASANTVYGAKAAAAAAQNDATIAKTKIETFLGTVTPDGSQDIIDTLAEINSYVGEHGEEFAALSGRVTKIEDGTTVVPKAADADKLDNHDSTYFATAESVTDITKDNGTIDSKIAAYNTSKNFGDVITHNASEFASSTENGAKELAQGVKDIVDTNKATWDKAGTALQASDLTAYDTSKKFGDIITHNVAEFATNAENGAKALADENKLAIDAINNADTGILAVANKYTDDEIGKLHSVATSGSIYDIEEHSTTDDGVVYLLLDCNW